MGTNFLIALGMELAAGVKLLAAATHEMYASAPEVLRQPMGSISYLNLTYAQARPKVHSARIKTEARSRFAYAMNTIHIVGGIKNMKQLSILKSTTSRWIVLGGLISLMAGSWASSAAAEKITILSGYDGKF